MEAHPAAEFFPLMTDEEFANLKADIAAHGLAEPIWLCEGKILDGRNRYRACRELSITPLFRDYVGPSPVAFAWSLNGERRHLTNGQRAAIGVEMLPALREESRKRQLANLRRGVVSPVPPKVGEREKNHKSEIVDEAARIVGTSGTSVQRAKAIRNSNPETFERIKDGTITIGSAYEGLKKSRAIPRAQPQEIRLEAIRRLVKEGNRCEQIAEALHITEPRVRRLARMGGIVLHDKNFGHVKRVDVHRVIEESVSTLEGVALGLKTVTGARLECSPHEAEEWAHSIECSMRVIGRLRKILRGSVS